MQKVAIIYGWSEGPKHGKKLRACLKKRGYTPVRNTANADIIIAHSGGAYVLPTATSAHTILLVGMPYWPGKHPVRSLREKVLAETKDIWWYKKTLLNSYYLITRPRRWYNMYRAWQNMALPQPGQHAATMVAVRNDNDHFVHPIDASMFAKESGWEFKVASGGHDDLWLDPEKYIDILDSISKTTLS